MPYRTVSCGVDVDVDSAKNMVYCEAGLVASLFWLGEVAYQSCQIA